MWEYRIGWRWRIFSPTHHHQKKNNLINSPPSSEEEQPHQLTILRRRTTWSTHHHHQKNNLINSPSSEEEQPDQLTIIIMKTRIHRRLAMANTLTDALIVKHTAVPQSVVRNNVKKNIKNLVTSIWKPTSSQQHILLFTGSTCEHLITSIRYNT